MSESSGVEVICLSEEFGCNWDLNGRKQKAAEQFY
jgi:hypothetical protein